MRNKNPEVCPLGTLAAYFFWRWHCSGEKFPDFSARKNWYDLCVFRGKDPKKPMSYNTQLRYVTAAYKALNISIRKKTHAARPSRSQRLEDDE